MIFTSIHSTDDFMAYPEAIRRVIEYLRSQDFMTMATGTYELQGKDIFVQVMDSQTGPIEEKRPESHNDYLDVQFLVSGEEKLGFTPNTGKYEVVEHIVERDLIFYKEVENEGFITATPGCISIFFPCDVHRPAIAVNDPMTIRKVVVKIRAAIL